MTSRIMMTPNERFLARMQEQCDACQAIVKIFEKAEAKQERFCNEVLGLSLAEVRARYRDDDVKRAEISAQYKTWSAANESL